MIGAAVRSVIVVFLGVAMISGCGAKPNATAEPEATAPPAPTVSQSASTPVPATSPKDASALEGMWIFKEIAGEKIIVPPDTRPPYIQFRADVKSVSGFAGCNTFSGSYETDGTALKLGPLISTRMACGPERDKIESAIHAALERVVRFSIQESDLNLIDADGGILITAEAVEQLEAIAEDSANP